MHRQSIQLCLSWFAVLFLFSACGEKKAAAPAGGDEFLRLSNVGKAQLDRAEGPAALASFEKALSLQPDHPDAQLNLANALLLNDQPERARGLAGRVLEADRASGAAHYVAGVAALRLRDFTNAIQMLQQAKDIDIRINAVSLRLGLAYEGLGKFEEALAQYEEIAQFDPNYPGVHFRLATVLRRLGREPEAQTQAAAHTAWMAKNPGVNLTPAGLERCKYTEARVPFQLEQPDRTGVKVVFTDVSAQALPGGGAGLAGPLATIDFARDGTNHLLVRQGESFRVLPNLNGQFQSGGASFPYTNGGRYTRWLIADLNKDGVPDALVLGDRGVHLYRFTTNGTATEATIFAGLRQFAAVDGLFVDLNFRGDLDLVAVGTNGALKVMSNLQNMYFVDASTNLPALGQVRELATDDWNNDETQDLFVRGQAGELSLLLKQRGGAWSNDLSMSRAMAPGGGALAVGDLNNDLRPDLIQATSGRLEVAFNGSTSRLSIPCPGTVPTQLKLVDYDNDGWLDVLAIGTPLRVFRNLGANGFAEVTAALGLAGLTGGVDSLVAADFDGDCDTDLVVSLTGGGLRFLRNDGGNQNHQLRLALQGTRSNSSALGIRVDVIAGGLRASRRVQDLPLEIGVGKHQMLDAVNAHWFELSPSYTEINLTNCAPLRIVELALPTGSCPYLYTWDGRKMRFVSDLLCAAPLGLPVAPGVYIESDPDEIAYIGNEETFQPKSAAAGGRGNYVLSITEELREVLYLDEARLLVVDHPPGTEVHATEKMRARRPAGGFPQDELVTLKNPRPLRSAVNEAGVDVTAALREIDQVFASPTRLRESQLRGLAEPHRVTFAFAGPLDAVPGPVLALTGWLRFGGGMANIAASSYADFPFPFPVLEAEVNGQWRPLDIEVGAPAGRAKTILVDLAGKLPAGTSRLRLTAAFEIHWDRFALFERAGEAGTTVTRLSPTRTDLHRRGYSELGPVTPAGPETLLVPDYAKVEPAPLWRITPGGWVTRYGAVDELIAARDNALALICGGDELTLEFAPQSLPARPAGAVREFFLFNSGWDKDSDFHVASGTTIEPLPWHGLNDQTYATAPRPAFTNDGWQQKYNTRWVGPRILSRR